MTDPVDIANERERFEAWAVNHALPISRNENDGAPMYGEYNNLAITQPPTEPKP